MTAVLGRQASLYAGYTNTTVRRAGTRYLRTTFTNTAAGSAGSAGVGVLVSRGRLVCNNAGTVSARLYCTPKANMIGMVPISIQNHAVQGVGRHIKTLMVVGVGAYAAVCWVGSTFLSARNTDAATEGGAAAPARVTRARKSSAKPYRKSKETKTWMQVLLDRMWAAWLYGGKVVGAVFRIAELSCYFAVPAIVLPWVVLVDYVFPGNAATQQRRWQQWWDVLLWAVENNGPALIKLAQWAASRKDLFPEQFCAQFGRLHEGAPMHGRADTDKAMLEAFGPRWTDHLMIESAPVGSGCVAQVYKGRLIVSKNGSSSSSSSGSGSSGGSGSSQVDRFSDAWVNGVRTNEQGDVEEPRVVLDVAVKVVHPAIRDYIIRDLAIVGAAVWVIELVPASEWLGLSGALSEFESLISSQLDLRTEAANLRRFNNDFAGVRGVVFPKPVDGWTAEGVLVESWEAGTTIARLMPGGKGATAAATALLLSQLSNDTVDTSTSSDGGSAAPAPAAVHAASDSTPASRAAGKLLARSFLQMLFTHNFAHGDLHPGNILVRPANGNTTTTNGDGDGSSGGGGSDDGVDDVDANEANLELVFLDAGIVTELKPQDFENFTSVFGAIVRRDGREAGQLILERSPHSRCPDPDAFVDGIEAVVDEALSNGLSLANIKVGELLGRVLSLACTLQVQLDPNFTKVAISIMVLEGVGRCLDPEQDLLTTARPYLVRTALGL